MLYCGLYMQQGKFWYLLKWLILILFFNPGNGEYCSSLVKVKQVWPSELVRWAEACFRVFLSFCPSFPPVAPWSLIFHTGAEDPWPSAPLLPLAPWQLHCKVHIPNCISIPLLPQSFSSYAVSTSVFKSSTLTLISVELHHHHFFALALSYDLMKQLNAVYGEKDEEMLFVPKFSQCVCNNH